MILKNYYLQSGTGVTNFDKYMLPVYQAAVKRYGDSDLFIKETSFTPEVEGCCSLHCKTKKDLGKFWNAFNEEHFKFLDKIFQTALQEKLGVRKRMASVKAGVYLRHHKEYGFLPSY